MPLVIGGCLLSDVGSDSHQQRRVRGAANFITLDDIGVLVEDGSYLTVLGDLSGPITQNPTFRPVNVYIDRGVEWHNALRSGAWCAYHGLHTPRSARLAYNLISRKHSPHMAGKR